MSDANENVEWLLLLEIVVYRRKYENNLDGSGG